MTTLIVGCSFVQNLNDPINGVDKDKFKFCGTAGSGNQAIAARVQHEISHNQDYEKVIVLWSGINRLDFPIGRPYHNTMPVDKDGYPAYAYYSLMNDVVWYHSGGWSLSGCSDESPGWFRDWCRTQYLSSTPRYLTDLSAQAIIATQGFLDKCGIPYQMAWIYDVDADYQRHFTGGHTGTTYIEPGCGKIDRNSILLNLIDWTKFTKFTPPYEFGNQSNSLWDGFHPHFESMRKWFKLALDVDLLD